MALKKKRLKAGLEIKTLKGKDGSSYLVLHTGGGSYHDFVEVEAKEAARQCGATKEDTTRQMWSSIW